jgi:ribonuclease III
VKWRKNYCETSEQISKKLQEMANDEEQASWIRASPADIYYRRANGNVVESTPRLDALCSLFDEELLKRADKTRATQAPYNAPARRRTIRVCRHKSKSESLVDAEIFLYFFSF